MDLRPQYGGIAYPARALSAVVAFIAHHSETTEPTSEAEAIQQIANIHAFHRDTRGWPGFAYNGAVWEGTYFRVRPANRMGWHSAGTDANQNGIGDWNEKGFAVVLLGNYSTKRPSARTLETLLAAKRLEESELGRTLELRGHRDGWATRCPGDWWSAWKAQVA